MRHTYIIITVLVICALLYLYLGITENFTDPLIAVHAQDRMNYLGANTNPAKNPAVPIGISVGEAAKIREMSMVALNSYDQKYPAAGGIVNSLPGAEAFTTGMTIATSLPISDETSMLALEKYCRENATGTNPFSDSKFAEFCGVCMVDGSKSPPNNTYSDGTPIPGNKGGVLVYPEDKAIAYTNQQENGYMYPRALPSLGRARCAGATTSDDDSKPPTLAIDANMYSDIRKRNICVATQDFAPDESCGKCVSDPDKWSYVKNPPEGNINTVLLVLVGSGLVSVLSNGQQVLAADGKNVVDVAIGTTPLVIDLGNYKAEGSLRGYIKEGERFTIVVKPNNLAVPYIGGFIRSTDPNGNPYVQELYNIVLNDSANAGNSPILGHPKLGVSGMGFSVKRIVPGNNVSRDAVVKINLICEMPLTFISPIMDPTSKKSQIAYYDCKSGPYTTTAAHADLLIKDECSGQRAGNYTDSCLKSKILAAGCSTGGSWYRSGLPAEAGANTNTLGSISSWINEKILEPTNIATSMGCYGINLSSPCDGNNKGSPECLSYMYNNISEKNILQGPAYSTTN